jgi:hypothetical protein
MVIPACEGCNAQNRREKRSEPARFHDLERYKPRAVAR